MGIFDLVAFGELKGGGGGAKAFGEFTVESVERRPTIGL